VVSAQRGVTDQLIAIATEIAENRTAPAIDSFYQIAPPPS